MQKVERKKCQGFTLIEVLIVVVILGILAATVLPQFTSASDDAKESATVQNLALLRSQVQLYKFQHEGRLPLAAELEEKLTSRTDIDGTTNPATGEFGPYITGQLSPNSYNGLRTVKAASASPIPVGDVDQATGWIYNEATGDMKINWNQPLVDQSGTSQTTFDL